MTDDNPSIDEAVEPILAPLREIERRGHNRFNIYSDWVELMLYALQREDEPYLEILEGYARLATTTVDTVPRTCSASRSRS